MIAEALELGRRLPVLRASVGRLRALQLAKLRTTLQAAYDTVPYYRELFDSAGLSPSDVRTFEDFARVPITTKRDLLDAGVQRTVRRGTNLAACVTLTTSGSSGEPLTVYMDRREVVTRNVLQFRALLTTGIRPWERLVVLGPVRWTAGGSHQRLGLWRREHVAPNIAVSEQIDRLRELQPDVLWIYPSFLRAIFDVVDGRLSDVCRPRTIITTAEVVDPEVFSLLRRDFSFAHFDFYGSIETGRMAWECRAHEGEHVNADVVYLELVDSGIDHDGHRLGETTVTVLEPRVTPLIRYKLGDLSTWLPENCRCGRAFPRIARPIGRSTQVVHLPSGRTLSAFGFMFVLREYAQIRRFRVVQESHDRFRVLLVPRGAAGDLPLDELRSRLESVIGEPAHFTFEVVDALDEINFKRTHFVSRLDERR